MVIDQTPHYLLKLDIGTGSRRLSDRGNPSRCLHLEIPLRQMCTVSYSQATLTQPCACVRPCVWTFKVTKTQTDTLLTHSQIMIEILTWRADSTPITKGHSLHVQSAIPLTCINNVALTCMMCDWWTVRNWETPKSLLGTALLCLD